MSIQKPPLKKLSSVYSGNFTAGVGPEKLTLEVNFKIQAYLQQSLPPTADSSPLRCVCCDHIMAQ